MEKSLTVNKKPAVILKEELAQKTDALNNALKRENKLKVCVHVCISFRKYIKYLVWIITPRVRDIFSFD